MSHVSVGGFGLDREGLLAQLTNKNADVEFSDRARLIAEYEKLSFETFHFQV